MIKKIAAAAVLSILASSSFAESPTLGYGGVDFGSTTIGDIASGVRKVSFGGFVGQGFNNSYAVEVGYRQPATWDNVAGTSADPTATHLRLSFVGSLPLNQQLDLYSRLGYTKLQAEATHLGSSYREDTTKALYGAGVGYRFGPGIAGRLEVQKPASDPTSVEIGIIWKF